MSKPVTVTLGKLAERAQHHLASGRYASMSEVVRAGLRALDREEEALDRLIREKLAEALADERPSDPATEAFARVRAARQQRKRASTSS